MSRHREITFSATCAHLCSAVRKLADVTRESADASASSASGESASSESIPLYRAVRGELPPAFWDADPQGMISAVDSAFMSTSRNPHTPIAYMTGEFNVLWQLRSSEPGDDAYHRGADISMLSQFAHEDEVHSTASSMRACRAPVLSAAPADTAHWIPVPCRCYSRRAR